MAVRFFAVALATLSVAVSTQADTPATPTTPATMPMSVMSSATPMQTVQTRRLMGRRGVRQTMPMTNTVMPAGYTTPATMTTKSTMMKADAPAAMPSTPKTMTPATGGMTPVPATAATPATTVTEAPVMTGTTSTSTPRFKLFSRLRNR